MNHFLIFRFLLDFLINKLNVLYLFPKDIFIVGITEKSTAEQVKLLLFRFWKKSLILSIIFLVWILLIIIRPFLKNQKWILGNLKFNSSLCFNSGFLLFLYIIYVFYKFSKIFIFNISIRTLKFFFNFRANVSIWISSFRISDIVRQFIQKSFSLIFV